MDDPHAEDRVDRFHGRSRTQWWRIERLDWIFGAAIVAFVLVGLLLLNFVWPVPR